MESMDYFRFFAALLFVIGLILLLSYALRRFSIGQRLMNAGNQNRRLSVSESTAIDPRHRLVLVKRDGVEHLLLIGPEQSLVVESDIQPVAVIEKLPVKKIKAGDNA